MAQIPTPPLSRQASEERQIEDQKKTSQDQDQVLLLDSLLERYLHLLDRHQTLQAEIGKQLSSVRYDFILYLLTPVGLAGLLFAHSCELLLSSRAEIWRGLLRPADESDAEARGKATKRECTLLRLLKTPSLTPDQETESSQSASTSLVYQVQYTPVISRKEESEDEKGQRDKAEQSDTNVSSTGKQQEDKDTTSGPGSPETSNIPTPSTSSEPPETEQETREESAKPPRKLFRSDDPLSWYGILVPPSLKNAQRSFTEAIEGNIPKLASVIHEMRQVEEHVHKLRKEIRLS
ncbi:hypothetical protein T310_9263 [Rasamsonia emersonii CBS 393.64]|uniref:Vacuolar ATPase assembly protein VMA22 n=1 Tax=Rasamsonia emersonii (strain ATCC 16479 / CBS 393.64 / IMI 116815) TaxID=1408163 RepID=A0A0F4YGK9_RASE3|nr:hypothetical protein T310_9263 [Rasamsonia emersonii CBS 393.64]KKA17086.1 hypothetical protein T310_9263 [Rasamsonia emersonii CBS 393.64]